MKKSKAIAKLKDKLLSECLRHDKSFNIDEFCAVNSVEIDVVIALIEMLSNLGFVKTIEVSSKTDGKRKAYLISPLSKGFFFLNVDGGFVESYQIQRRQKIWNIVKIAAAVTNAIIIILIACIGIYYQVKFNKSETERDELNIQIENLKKQRK